MRTTKIYERGGAAAIATFAQRGAAASDLVFRVFIFGWRFVVCSLARSLARLLVYSIKAAEAAAAAATAAAARAIDARHYLFFGVANDEASEQRATRINTSYDEPSGVRKQTIARQISTLAAVGARMFVEEDRL